MDVRNILRLHLVAIAKGDAAMKKQSTKDVIELFEDLLPPLDGGKGEPADTVQREMHEEAVEATKGAAEKVIARKTAAKK